MKRIYRGKLASIYNWIGVKAKPGQVFMFGFMMVILFGTVLLTLPIATRDGEGASFVTALFTATSATCVTGLVIQDTYTYWSVFGHCVILFLIQLGGLGFMTLISIVTIYTNKVIGLKERMIMAQSLNLEEMSGIVRLTKRIICGTFLFEGMGAIILSVRYSREFGVAGGIYKGIFHAVSAFCNAGFDLLGEVEKYSSLMSYSTDFVINVTTMLLIIIGGIGFFVWEDIWVNRGFHNLQVHTKLVLVVTGILIVGGWVLFYLLEHSNPETLGPLSEPQKLLASLFQSVTTRTAGFNTIDQAAMSEGSKALTILLMFIGGSPGSTAGGIKTATLAVLLISSVNVLRGKQDHVVFKRSIPQSLIMNAQGLVTIAISFIIVGSFAISLGERIPFFTVMFETVSAFGTVGLSMNLTPSLSTFSWLILTFMMYAGRVGILTIGIGILSRHYTTAKIKYPEAKLFVG